ATFSLPYFSVTYSITSSRLVSAKSKSISGAEGRSGFKKRSKGSLKKNGSASVIFKEYDTTEPAADPRPGPTAIPLSFAQLTKSATTRKYVSYFFFVIIDNSYSTRSLISVVISPYRIFAPS